MKLLDNISARTRVRSDRQGAVIILFLALVIIVSSVGMVLLRTGISVTNRQEMALDGKNAFYLAESGLAEAYWGLRNGKTGQVGTKTEPVYFGGGLFWVDTFPQGDDVYLLQSTGMYGRGRAALSLAVRASAVGDTGASQGVFSRQNINVSPGVKIDGFDSKAGTYEEQLDANGQPTVLGALASNGDIALAGTATNQTVIQGDVHVGPNSTLMQGIGSVVTGSTTPLADLVSVDPVVVPTYSLSPAPLSVTNAVPQLISGADTELGQVVVEPGGILVLRGPLNVVVDSLDVQPEGELQIDSLAGEVNLYTRKGIILQPGSVASTTSSDPWQFRVRAEADDPKTPQVEGLSLLATGAMHCIIDAPDTAVTLGSQLELFGAITGDQVDLQAGATFHVDVSTMAVAADDIRMRADETLLWEIVSLPSEAVGPGDPFQVLGVNKATLTMPFDSHRVLWLTVDYTDASGTAQVWTGWSDVVDPALLRKISRVQGFIQPTDAIPVYEKKVTYLATKTGDVVGQFGF